MRVLLCAFCLIAIHAGGATAQMLASAADNPVPAQAPVTDGTTRSANTIPEVIRGPDQAAQPKATSAPAAALTPPAIDPRFLQASRLDRDELGTSR
jgi:hypothetical protein